MVNMNDSQLREELTAFGINVGPINDTTRETYMRVLAKKKGSPSRSSTRKSSSSPGRVAPPKTKTPPAKRNVLPPPAVIERPVPISLPRRPSPPPRRASPPARRASPLRRPVPMSPPRRPSPPPRRASPPARRASPLRRPVPISPPRRPSPPPRRASPPARRASPLRRPVPISPPRRPSPPPRRASPRDAPKGFQLNPTFLTGVAFTICVLGYLLYPDKVHDGINSSSNYVNSAIMAGFKYAVMPFLVLGVIFALGVVIYYGFQAHTKNKAIYEEKKRKMIREILKAVYNAPANGIPVKQLRDRMIPAYKRTKDELLLWNECEDFVKTYETRVRAEERANHSNDDVIEHFLWCSPQGLEDDDD